MRALVLNSAARSASDQSRVGSAARRVTTRAASPRGIACAAPSGAGGEPFRWGLRAPDEAPSRGLRSVAFEGSGGVDLVAVVLQESQGDLRAAPPLEKADEEPGDEEILRRIGRVARLRDVGQRQRTRAAMLDAHPVAGMHVALHPLPARDDVRPDGRCKQDVQDRIERSASDLPPDREDARQAVRSRDLAQEIALCVERDACAGRVGRRREGDPALRAGRTHEADQRGAGEVLAPRHGSLLG